MLEDFERTSRGREVGFHDTISNKVKTMAITTKSIQVGDTKIYDLNTVNLGIIALLPSDRDVQVKDELAPVPTAMFTEKEMQICKAKSSLRISLQVEMTTVSSRLKQITASRV